MLQWLAFLVFSLVVHAVTEPRIVAMGDLHGDLNNTLTIMRFAGLIDQDNRWSGGDTIFVQTGDVVDRGVDTIALYELLQRLRDEAQEQGGQVVSVLGNHEIMNMVGDWRYVHPDDIASFGGKEARIKAFSKEGWIGSDLMKWNLTAKVGSSVFCHGGILPKYSHDGIDGINRRAKDSLETYINERDDTYGLFGGDGPTWYRGFAVGDERICAVLDKALTMLEADRMVMGHTVQRDGRIRARCGGKAILIDIGISHVYGGHAGALEIQGDQIHAVYEHGKEKLVASRIHEEL
ncbi:serine threonine protein [Lichtheimia corymbifera JMRC:FSU:9682]|uniref:Serine threonine protein n=1 Tax=Lichtheimia corymbifera JMRC:FSU:9682 TaxID=1263082 RepID=A0A068SAB4_9FUNG|nr:serine threonine protein [Lichtheimia corymbifera JMRC:FSU:9682]